MQGKARTWIALGLIVFLASVSYANALRGGFVWDDWNLIAGNSHIKSWGNLGRKLTSDFFQRSLDKPADQKAGYYRPIITLTYMLDYSLSGQNPLGYHITNLIWHIACGIIIYLLVGALFYEPQLSLIASLLFVTHPVHAESVAWISGRTDVICAFFFLSSLYLYTLAYLTNRRGKNLSLAGSLALFILALLAKEMAVILPLILILIDYFIIVKDTTLRGLRERVKSWIPYWMVLFIYLIVRFAVSRVEIGTASNVAFISKYYILLTFGRAILHYLKELICPVILNPYIRIELITSVFSAEIMLVILILAISIFLAYITRKTDKVISFSILFFWISLMPLSNLIPIRAPADILFPMALRYLYLPSFAFCLLVAGILHKLPALKPGGISPEIFVFAAWLILYTRRTVYANAFWQNDLALFERAAELSPDSPEVYYSLGSRYFKMKDYDNTLRYYLKAIDLKDNLGIVKRGENLSVIYTSLSRSYFFKGDVQKAITAAQTAIRYDDQNAQDHLSLSRYYLNTGKPSLGRKELNRALELNPSYREMLKNATSSDK